MLKDVKDNVEKEYMKKTQMKRDIPNFSRSPSLQESMGWIEDMEHYFEKRCN